MNLSAVKTGTGVSRFVVVPSRAGRLRCSPSKTPSRRSGARRCALRPGPAGRSRVRLPRGSGSCCTGRVHHQSGRLSLEPARPAARSHLGPSKTRCPLQSGRRYAAPPVPGGARPPIAASSVSASPGRQNRRPDRFGGGRWRGLSWTPASTMPAPPERSCRTGTTRQDPKKEQKSSFLRCSTWACGARSCLRHLRPAKRVSFLSSTRLGDRSTASRE